MQKRLLLLLMLRFSASSMAQVVEMDTSEHAPPPVRHKVITADPDDRSDLPRFSKTRLSGDRRDDYLFLQKLQEQQSWYLSAEGGLRTGSSQLTSSLSGLISSPALTKGVWGILAGYTYRNAWTIEAGYVRSPVYLPIKIANGSDPLFYTYQNSGNALPLRLKRRLGSGKRAENGTGFWLTGGVWLIPNGSVASDDFNLIGYTYANRGTRIDTLRLSNTTTTESISGLAEAGIEYNIRLSSAIELGTYIRKYWGLGTALHSDVRYTVNKTAERHASLTANGTGWGFGVTLRYIYGKQHALKQP